MEKQSVPTQPAPDRPATTPSAVTPPPAPSPAAPPEPGLPADAIVERVQTPSHEQLAAATAKMQRAFHAPPAPAEPKTTVTPPPAKK
jgi:hypothetical protein